MYAIRSYYGYRRLLVLIVVASIPTALIGLGFKYFFEGLFANIPVVAAMLLVTGTLLWLAERLARGGRLLETLNWRDALLAVITSYSIHYTKLYESNFTTTGAYELRVVPDAKLTKKDKKTLKSEQLKEAHQLECSS